MPPHLKAKILTQQLNSSDFNSLKKQKQKIHVLN